MSGTKVGGKLLNDTLHDQPDPDDAMLPVILALWREVLSENAAAIQAETHFFLAGGDSLQLARLLQRIRQQLGLTLQLQDAAAFSTPAKMCIWCQRLASQGRASKPCVRAATGQTQVYPASSMQQGLWYETQCAGDKALYNTALALHLRGKLDAELLQDALTLLNMQHPVLRSRFSLSPDSKVLQVHTAPMEKVPLPLESVNANELSEVLICAASQPFDLGTQNPCRFHMYRPGADHHVLSVCLHHCVTDGGSGNILLRNLASIWNNLLANRSWLPTYRDTGQARYCHAEAQGRKNGDFREDLAWWQQQAQYIDRCTDWIGATEQSGPFPLSTEIRLLRTSEFRPVVCAAFPDTATACSYLLAAFRLALFRLTGARDILVGMPVSSRHNVNSCNIDLMNSAGCFVNLVLSHGCIEDGEPAGTLVQRLHMYHLQALSHASAPFADVARALNLDRCASGNIGFDVLFAFQNSPELPATFEGLVHSLQPVTPRYGQYPLTLTIHRSDSGYLCRLDYTATVLSAQSARLLLITCQEELHRLCAQP